MVGDLIATPLGVAAMLDIVSIEGCSTDASPLILPQPHKGVAIYFAIVLFSRGIAMLPEPLKGFP